MFVEGLQAAKSALRTVLHAPIAKQEMLQQQGIAVPSVQWKMNRTSVKPWETSGGNVVGGVEMETSVEQEKTFQTENFVLPAISADNKSAVQRGKCRGRNCTYLWQHGLCGTLRQVLMGVHR